MWKTLLVSFRQALANSWNNLFHTFLSILGIVIGVAALVGILSLIDGMEQYANEQIASTTSLQSIVVLPKIYDTIDGVRVPRDTYPVFTYADYAFLRERTDTSARMSFRIRENDRFTLDGDTTQRAAVFYGVTSFIAEKVPEVLEGRLLMPDDLTQARPLAVITKLLADSLRHDQPLASLPGRTIEWDEQQLEIIGIVANRDFQPAAEVYLPLSILPPARYAKKAEAITFFAASAEDVVPLKTNITALLAERFPDQQEEFDLIIDEFRLDQLAQGFLLFRLVMGLIVGIAVLVGGIGVMNVLLISVTERTREIGLRKAMGAKKSDIILQFLAESITVSSLGSVLGLLLGMLGAMAIVPIVKMVTDAPFQAAFTVNTLIVVGVIAVVIGIIFGTYPAMRAARLDPVEAIRRE